MIRMRRSLLFVPGDDERKIQRAFASAADTILFDLEDAVAPGRKDFARSVVATALRTPTNGQERAVRVNPEGTPQHDRDIETAIECGADAILLPKCDGPATAARVAATIERLDPDGNVRLLALVESASAVLAASEFRAGCSRLDALCFGHVDLSLDMGLEQADASRGVLLHARCQVALAARAAALTAIDSICLDFRNIEACRSDARFGRELGYEGKFCIHPAQAEIVNAAFTPGTTEVSLAREVVAAWDEATPGEVGVIAHRGKMIDAPVVALYRRILERAAWAESRDAQRSAS